jgi:hypothetical protein
VKTKPIPVIGKKVPAATGFCQTPIFVQNKKMERSLVCIAYRLWVTIPMETAGASQVTLSVPYGVGSQGPSTGLAWVVETCGPARFVASRERQRPEEVTPGTSVANALGSPLTNSVASSAW